jgi:amidohydrolase
VGAWTSIGGKASPPDRFYRGVCMAQDVKAAARKQVEQQREELIGLSHRIHANPELGYQEVKASGWVAGALADAGMDVETGVAGLPTAFRARAGSGPLHVGICAEYDALPEIGHACGHNVIAAAAVGAGIALAKVADEVGLTVTVFGTPAEEGGGGKILMLERGAFDGVHAAMMVHPSPHELVEMPIIAASHYDVHYTGKDAHAAAWPERGVNAADALVVAQTAIGLLRQHMRQTDRVHGIVTKGGDAPNIIPSHTSARYIIRAGTLAELDDIRAKVLRCFEAGALATGAEVEIKLRVQPYAEVRHDPDLAAAYRRSLDELGRPYQEVTGDLARAAGSTDMGNVSLRIPSIHPGIGIDSLPAVNHQPEFTAAAATPAADQAVIDGAIAMAWTAIEAATNEAVRTRLLASTGAGAGAGSAAAGTDTGGGR